MKESYGEGVATHSGPESCVWYRKVSDEALTGVHAGQPLSCERERFRVPTLLSGAEGNIGAHAGTLVCIGPGVVEDPVHAWKLLARNAGDPVNAHWR